MPDGTQPIERSDDAAAVANGARPVDRTSDVAADLDETTDAEVSRSEESSPSDLDRLDELLEKCLEAYLQAAPLDSTDQLAQFLPEADVHTQRFLLAELIKLDMASVAEMGEATGGSNPLPRIEDYLTHFPQVLTEHDVPLDLVMEEIQLRKETGEALDADEYAGRFPQHASMVAELLGGQLSAKPEATASAIYRKRPPELRVGQQIDDFVVIQTLGHL